MGRKDQKEQSGYQITGVFLAVGAAFMASIAYIAMRIVNKSVHYIFSPYYLCTTGLVICSAMYIFDSGMLHVHEYDTSDVIHLTSAGIFSLIGQLLLSIAFKHADASIASPLLYIN